MTCHKYPDLGSASVLFQQFLPSQRHYPDLGSASVLFQQFLPSQRHYPDLGSDVYQNGISLLNPQTSFCRETSTSAVFSDYLKW